ncbi:hypothetical protein I302_108234 [Kwoniella bestiolae CBS 10118]|uniref:Extradiol ring-cleavage dioxygenase class III enzyme subunit B domain-containing protein n=1 Tax=Kwoniella bestiolae CBS 10118 TaxID=1296100 RepID=A0A1B9FWB6_9TREE|nr:hypothetical protein I302_07401 [Kwoniella bestiolae CBS 10118]OCF23050.1 hypothetical protein I302_07401 [Kwoniella bestiolae CBS 10118]
MVNQSSTKGDVYFLSHGGPPTVEQTYAEPYKAWQKFGQIINQDPPRGIVVVSAHWENESGFRGSGGVLVNSNPTNPLIYDFYNFPKRLYELKFRSSFSTALESTVLSALKTAGLGVGREDRGLDHGVWIPFRAAFGESTQVPIIQVSLPASSDPRASIKLGQALSQVRDEGYTVVATGQSVHNLRDLFTGQRMLYTKPFLNLLNSSLSSTDPISSTIDILKTPLYKKAHPTDEHFFPLFVALGALREGESKRKETLISGVWDAQGMPAEDEGLGWSMYRWLSE